MISAESARKPGRPAQISRDQILAAVASMPNVDSVTMRGLAAALDVQHGALYRWVKNRDELFDLIGAAVVDNVLSRCTETTGDWRTRLGVMIRAVHDEFGALPGYATHLSRPHPHNAHSTERLRDAVVTVLLEADVPAELAEQSWYIVITSVVGWLAFAEQQAHPGSGAPSFDTFLDVLLRGLPARHQRS